MKLLINRSVRTDEKRGMLSGKDKSQMVFTTELRVDMTPEERTMARHMGLYEAPLRGMDIDEGESGVKTLARFALKKAVGDTDVMTLKNLVEDRPYVAEGGNPAEVEEMVDEFREILRGAASMMELAMAYSLDGMREEVEELLETKAAVTVEMPGASEPQYETNADGVMVRKGE